MTDFNSYNVWNQISAPNTVDESSNLSGKDDRTNGLTSVLQVQCALLLATQIGTRFEMKFLSSPNDKEFNYSNNDRKNATTTVSRNKNEGASIIEDPVWTLVLNLFTLAHNGLNTSVNVVSKEVVVLQRSNRLLFINSVDIIRRRIATLPGSVDKKSLIKQLELLLSAELTLIYHGF